MCSREYTPVLDMLATVYARIETRPAAVFRVSRCPRSPLGSLRGQAMTATSGLRQWNGHAPGSAIEVRRSARNERRRPRRNVAQRSTAP